MNSLVQFLRAVERRVRDAVSDAAFHRTQRELLEQSLERCAPGAAPNPLGEPLALLYLVARAGGRELDEQAERVAAFCYLYILALDLLDDVQDDDLAGKPHESVGPAIAINSALTLLFLGLRELHVSIELERNGTLRSAYLRLFGRVSLLAVAGQHRDLMGNACNNTPAEVLAMHQAKTSSVSLLTECGALLARCDDESAQRYREIGEQLAMLVQVRDDLRDIFGKQSSPDLKTAKVTYPVSCYLAKASPAAVDHFEQLVARLPESLDALRSLLYESGAVEASALELERCRAAIHERVAGIGKGAAHRTLLDMADGIAETVYAPPRLHATLHFWRPRGPWHDAVHRELSVFMERMQWLGCPTPPELRPWHLSQWTYDADRKTIFYPDVEGQPEEVLPFQAELLGTSDISEVDRIMRRQLPAVLAHEMFHFWRDAARRLTRDHWHEEWAANRLAVAYLGRHAPEILKDSLALARSVVDRFPGAINAHAERILGRCGSASAQSLGYEVEMLETALIGLEMVLRLAGQSEDLADVSRELLTPASRAGYAA